MAVVGLASRQRRSRTADVWAKIGDQEWRLARQQTMRHMCNTTAMLKAIAVTQAADRRVAIELAQARGIRISEALVLVESSQRAVTNAARKAEADAHTASVAPFIAEVRAAGAKSLRQIAAALNARGITTARGGRWEAQTVANILRRAA